MRIPISLSFVLLGLLLLVPARCLAASETNAETAAVPMVSSENTSGNDSLRAYLQLQEQLHATQLAIEQTRHDSEAANAKAADQLRTQMRDELTTQLRLLQESLFDRSTRETHFVMYVLSALGGISFLAVVITAYFQWRTVNRLADFTAALPANRQLGTSPTLGALGFNEKALLTVGAVEQSNGQLLSAIERLERRIRELEQTATPALNEASTANGETSNGHAAEGTISAPDFAQENPEPAARVKQLLHQGQMLLNEDKADAAIECFDQVLTMDSENTEALVKKGAALEKLRKLTEAIECYDRAIAVDGSMTIAYLHKGGLYNRMERFGEAVECYEKALRTQEKRSAA